MSIVPVSSLPKKIPEMNDSILIADQFKCSLGEIENYLSPHRPDIGRNLVDVLGVSNAKAAWAELKKRADAGNFAGLRIGDYIDVDSMTIGSDVLSNANQRLRFIIAGFDTYYRVGGTDLTSHHILMIAKNVVFQKAMNPTATNAGGYPKSDLKAYLDSTVKPGLISAIGITPKTVHRYLDNMSSWEPCDEVVFIPTEVEVFGHQAWSKNQGYSTGTSIQWPIFSIYPQMRQANYNGSRWWYWEASPDHEYNGGTSYFAYVSGHGYASYGSANRSDGGVRFAFLV